jgi:hypothetical protein
MANEGGNLTAVALLTAMFAALYIRIMFEMWREKYNRKRNELD